MLGPQGHDPSGATDVAVLAELQADFRRWMQSTYGNEDGRGAHASLRSMAQKEKENINDVSAWRTEYEGPHLAPGVSSSRYNNECLPCTKVDNRLSVVRTQQAWGLTAAEIANPHVSRVYRLQTMVAQRPSCLSYTWPEVAPHGEYFYPIDENWLATCGDLHWSRTNLCDFLKLRINNMVFSDFTRYIRGMVTSPQPEGRYISYTDVIEMWNKSLGWCGHGCGRQIYLMRFQDMTEHSELRCDKRRCNLECHKATVQRLSNDVIHLAGNCAPVMTCKSCNSALKG